MGDEGRMMNFVSEKQLDELRAARGVRPEDGTISVDKPLWEILKGNKEAKDAEWAEKHRHKTQKALDEDEVDFLDAVDLHQREQEQVQKDVEAQEMAAFQAALLEKQLETEDATVSKQQEEKGGRQAKAIKRAPDKPLDKLASMIKVKSVPKKTKTMEQNDTVSSKQTGWEVESIASKLRKPRLESPNPNHKSQTLQAGGLLGLQQYGDDDDEDE